MSVHHLRMLDRHRVNYNKQDTVLARLLYHLNTAHINASVSRACTTLWPSVAPTIVRKTRYATCTLTHLQQSLTPRPAIGPQRWFNAGPRLLVRIINKTLAQHWVNAYNWFHLYINMLFFRLTSRINPSCQTDVVLITADKLKRDDRPCMILTVHVQVKHT